MYQNLQKKTSKFMHKIQKCHQIKMDDRIYDGRSRLASSRHLHIAVRWALALMSNRPKIWIGKQKSVKVREKVKVKGAGIVPTVGLKFTMKFQEIGWVRISIIVYTYVCISTHYASLYNYTQHSPLATCKSILLLASTTSIS